MKKSHLLVLARLVTATVVLVAISTQLAYGLGQGNFSIVNFFSFFTILSNFLAAVVFFASGAALLAHVRDPILDNLRGATTLYMVITGIVYVILLSNVDVQTPIPWVNAVIHYIFPIIILADWLIAPPARAITRKQALVWLVFPVVYAVYSLVRGPFAHHWYPYPFINVAELGYLQVLVNCVLLAIVGAVLALLIAKLPQLLPKRRAIS